MLFEHDTSEHPFIFKKPIFDQILSTGTLMNIETREEYLVLQDPHYFDIIREHLLSKYTPPQREIPIYYNMEQNVFYYPEISFKEEMPLARPLRIKFELIDKNDGIFECAANEMAYRSIRTPQSLSLQRTSVEIRQAQSALPIYYDRKYFIPYEALTELIPKPRVIVPAKPLLKPLGDEIVDMWTLEKYVTLDSIKDFVNQRKDLLKKVAIAKCKILRYADYVDYKNCVGVGEPVYYDINNGFYYVPVGDAEDGGSRYRDVICGSNPPVVYSVEFEGYVSVVTGEEYKQVLSYQNK